jgi:twitching motility protein PilT
MMFQEWVRKAREAGASDLHAEADGPLIVRVRGKLQPLGETSTEADLQRTGEALLGADGWAAFLSQGSADVSLELAGTRCRINFFRTVRGVAFAVRLLAASIKDLRSCNLHPDLRRLTEPTNGLVVVSGPTGSGKSTTLAALIEEINATQARNIITLESPLEYVHTNRRSFIRQREIPTHSPSFEQAITDALRENPDVLVISEMRTPEVMRLTLNAAETGHLVLATMHSATCAEALTRICMSFPADIQGSIRAQLADCLVGILCQRLDFLSSRRLLVPRCELMLANTAAKGTIRAGTFSHLANVIQSGGEEGMWSFDRYARWMEQRTDWVRADTASPLDTQRSAAVPARSPAGLAPGAPALAPGRSPATPTSGAAAPTRSPPAPSRNPAAPTAGAPAPARGPSTPARGPAAPTPGTAAPTEQDMDLAELNELVDRLEKRGH